MKTIIHYKTFKIRLLPTEDQEQLMWKNIDACRFCYNWGLEVEMERFKNNEKFLSGYELKKLFNGCKNNLYPWINSVSQTALSQIFMDLDNAYKSFFTKQKQKKLY